MLSTFLWNTAQPVSTFKDPPNIIDNVLWQNHWLIMTHDYHPLLSESESADRRTPAGPGPNFQPHRLSLTASPLPQCPSHRHLGQEPASSRSGTRVGPARAVTCRVTASLLPRRRRDVTRDVIIVRRRSRLAPTQTCPLFGVCRCARGSTIVCQGLRSLTQRPPR